MALKALRDASKGGVGKFILFGFLTLAVAGLALTDIGGFFRGDASGNTVIKVAGKDIHIRDFDRTVRQRLNATNLSAQDAYAMGYINQIIASEIRTVFMEKDLDHRGITLSQDQIANHITTIITPMLEGDQTPKAFLQQVIAAQGLSEKAFAASIAQELKTDLITNTVAAGTVQLNTGLIDALHQFQNETRNVGYLKFYHSEIKVKTPDEATLRAYYDDIRESYKIEETRAIEVVMLDNKAIEKDKSLSASAILEKKFNYVEQLEDLLASDVSTREIKSSLPVKITSIQKIGRTGQLLDNKATVPRAVSQNLKAIAKEAFTVASEESSMAIELPGAKFAAIRVLSISPQSYHPFDKIKQQLEADWKLAEQRKRTEDRVHTALSTIQNGTHTLEDYAKKRKRTYRTLNTLKRDIDNELFKATATRKIFSHPKHEKHIVEIEGGLAIVETTHAEIASLTTADREGESYTLLRNALTNAATDQAISTILDAAHTKNPARVNGRLLERVYGREEY